MAIEEVERERTTMSEITEAVQHLYEIFARYPPPALIECCLCGCTKPDETAHLVAVPLRNISFADLSDYCFSAITTQGLVDDFRYLLPRILEGIAEQPFGCNPEILFGKLKCADWLTWSEDEIAAVRDYLRALWRTALNASPLEEHLPPLHAPVKTSTGFWIHGPTLRLKKRMKI
jgi:hypothetical protein